jgi:hypothetical protein
MHFQTKNILKNNHYYIQVPILVNAHELIQEYIYVGKI